MQTVKQYVWLESSLSSCDNVKEAPKKIFLFLTCCQLKCKPSALYSLSLKSLKNSQPVARENTSE